MSVVVSWEGKPWIVWDGACAGSEGGCGALGCAVAKRLGVLLAVALGSGVCVSGFCVSMIGMLEVTSSWLRSCSCASPSPSNGSTGAAASRMGMSEGMRAMFVALGGLEGSEYRCECRNERMRGRMLSIGISGVGGVEAGWGVFGSWGGLVGFLLVSLS